MPTISLDPLNVTLKKPFVLKKEFYGDELYEYYALGNYIVSAPQICGGRPTFKYTRLEVTVILALLAMGQSLEQLLQDYADSQLSRPAIQEAIYLASSALVHSTQTLPLVA